MLITCRGVAREQIAVNPTRSLNSIVTSSTFRGLTLSPDNQMALWLNIFRLHEDFIALSAILCEMSRPTNCFFLQAFGKATYRCRRKKAFADLRALATLKFTFEKLALVFTGERPVRDSHFSGQTWQVGWPILDCWGGGYVPHSLQGVMFSKF